MCILLGRRFLHLLGTQSFSFGPGVCGDDGQGGRPYLVVHGAGHTVRATSFGAPDETTGVGGMGGWEWGL